LEWHETGKQVDFPLGGYSYVNAVSARATAMMYGPLGRANGGCGFAYCYATVHWDGNAWSGISPTANRESPRCNHFIDFRCLGSRDGFNARSGYPTGTYTLHYTLP